MTSLLLTAGGVLLVRSLERRVVEADFRLHAAARVAEVQRLVDGHVAEMRTLAGILATTPQAGWETFRRRTRDWSQRAPGLRWIGWAPLTSRWERQARVAMVRAERFPRFRIRERHTDGTLVPAHERKTHFPLCYVVPDDRVDARGFDLASDRGLRAVLDGIEQSEGVRTATLDPISGAPRAPEATLIIVPIVTPAIGLTPLRLHGVVAGQLDVAALASMGRADERLTVHVRTDELDTPGARGLRFRIAVKVGKHPFPVTVPATPSFFDTTTRWVPEVVLAGGLLFTAIMLGGWVRMHRGHQLLERRTTELRKAKDDLQEYLAQRREAEGAMRHSEERYRSLGVASSQIIWTTDASGRVESDLLSWRAFTGQSHEEIRGDGWLDAVHDDDREEVLTSWREAVQTKSKYQWECRVRRADGVFRDFQFRGVPVKGIESEVREWVGSCTDITERNAAVLELRRARHTAEDANRLKSEFLANMSHEIRTPMNAILGMTELAIETDLTTEQGEYLGAVQASAESLLRIINDILDFSKIEAGKLELEQIEFGLRETVAQTLRTLAVRAHKIGIELAADVDCDVPDRLVGDPSRLRQVLINLLGNAIKFTEHGEVVIEVSTTPCDDGATTLRCAVRDTGIGIAEEKQRAIFSAFTQADGSTTRRYGGTGLGLAITTQLVELMHGSITLESTPGAGSTFAFTARLGVPAEQPEPPRPSVDGCRVLVYDDNSTTRGIIARALRSGGADVVAAATGAEAAAHENDETFDLLVLDGVAPDRDGFGVVAAARAAGRSIPTIMLVETRDQKHAMQRCRELGVTWIVKPVRIDELASEAERALGRAVTETAPSVAPVAASGHGLRILVAEDTPLNQKLALRLLEKLGHEVAIVTNGREALDIAARQHFDVILMDVQMPEMGGLEATAAIRERERANGGRVPIVAMTAHAMTGYREKCLAAGMDDYVSKPIRRPALVAALDRVAARAAAEETP
ncbi:MAG: response regulator [Planctomycetota bacterium]|nr:response regulator [Planctomycetota bacterium]